MMRKHPLPFHVISSLLFSLLTVAVGGIIGLSAYAQQRQLLLAATQDLFERSLREIQTELRAHYAPVQAQIALIAQTAEAREIPPAHRWLRVFSRMLETNPTLVSICWADVHGRRIELQPLHHADARRRAHAPAEAAFIAEVVAPPERSTHFYTEHLASLPASGRAGTTNAMPESSLRVIYLLRDGRESIQASIGLKHLSATLSSLRATPSTQLAILDDGGHLLAATQGSWNDAGGDSLPPTLADMGLHLLARVVEQPPRDRTTTQLFGHQYWEVRAERREIVPELSVQIVMAAPHDEILADANALLQRTLVITALTLLLALPAILAIARQLSQSLRALAATAAEARAFRFLQVEQRSWIREVDMLGATLAQMCATIQRFLDISTRLAAERDHDRLSEKIVAQTIAISGAGGGVAYLRDEQKEFAPVAWRHTGADTGTQAVPCAIGNASAPLCEWFGKLDRPATHTLSPASLPPGLEWLGAWFPGQAVDLLLVPLVNRDGHHLGLLLLVQPHRDAGYDTDIVDFVGALSGTLASTIEKQLLLAGRQALLDGIIRMIAGAIDARSPYTSAHCRRVPLIVSHLADAANHHPDSPFKGQLATTATTEALHLAAWLHDCGKLFVPDYITDKSVKLETVYNRIHEIRTRFEILKRDADLACWQGIAAGGDAAQLRQIAEAAKQELDEEFAFVARCNRGEPPLSDADIARLVKIGERIWWRTIDDRLGLAEEEMRRKCQVPARPLPAREHLLADRLEHLIGSYPPPEQSEISVGKTTLHPPRHRLNIGELYCLCVRAGTLTAEERYLINAHILGTIAMLSSLPFPAELADVAEIAGSHHEHLDGSGYPFGRQASDLSLETRIIALADVYEALTAADRPYKPGKSPAEALEIMAVMARQQHLDGELLELFIKAEIPSLLHGDVKKPSSPLA